jgi:hypothetical protein
MRLSDGRTWYLLLILCLVVTLAACGGTPTPEAEPPTPSPTAAAAGSTTAASSTPALTVEPQAPAAATSTLTPSAEPQAPATATATPTPTPGTAAGPTPTTPPPSRCAGLAGQLELQVLVGPAEAVGLEPVAVGTVPFAVTTSEPPYLVEGQGPISYDATLTREWGTYAVTMDLETAVQGECSGAAGNEQLTLVLEMTGEQLVVVDAEGFHGEYPWEGTQTRDLAFPLEEGATAQGEGWAVVLHLGGG